MCDDNNNKKEGFENEGEKDNITLESLTSELLKKDNELSEKDKRIDELEKAYKILYERGKFQSDDNKQVKETEKTVSYDDILNRL